MKLSRRAVLECVVRGVTAGLPMAQLFAQGIASRGARPTPRGKPSGIPFLTRFIDIAETAGLHALVFFGPDDHKSYIFGDHWLRSGVFVLRQ